VKRAATRGRATTNLSAVLIAREKEQELASLGIVSKPDTAPILYGFKAIHIQQRKEQRHEAVRQQISAPCYNSKRKEQELASISVISELVL